MNRVKKQQGFSLVELVVVIVLLGIMSVGAGMLITGPIEAYRDQSRRQQLVDLAEISLRKIANDIRAALPNSIRVVDTDLPNSWALEMVNTVAGARYRDEAGSGFTMPNDMLTFTAVGDTQFNMLGLFSTLPSFGLPITYNNYRAVIYSTDDVTIYSDAALNSNPGIFSPNGVTLNVNVDPLGVTDDEHHLTLSSGHQFSSQSPTQRLFLVDGPVSYICDTATGLLMRFDSYAYQVNQSSTDTVAELNGLSANSGRVTSNVSSCNILYQPGSAQRGGLISIDLTLTDSAGESVRLMHQVHVDNVP